jgi:hypothetical protein
MNRLRLAAALLCSAVSVAGQSKGYAPPRTADGKPDLQGIWQVRNTAASALEDHGASEGIAPGRGVIVDPPDGKIPYQEWAAQKRRENYQNRASADPLGKCFLAGVPRITYLPFPFQIFQTPQFVAVAYEYDHTGRTIFLNGSKHLDDIDFWMGDSRGHWEGDTLVVDVANINNQTWFDLAGDFHSEDMKLTERYTRTGPDTIQYEVAIQDPKVFTRPWKISMPLYRHTEKDFQLYEYECHVYLEEARQKGKAK